MSNSFYFKVNDSITLKLEDEDVNIYVAGELFNQCKAILLKRYFSELEELDKIDYFCSPSLFLFT